MQVNANGLTIEVLDSARDSADPEHYGRPTVLLVIGLGLQLIDWPVTFVQSLLDAGYRVVRFDNRDAGLSTHLSHLGKPPLFWLGLQYKLGLAPKAPYTLTDMAVDTVGVLDALQIDRAHVVGISMGGMIAQRVALSVPHRVLSLTSIMSSSGARGLPGPQPRVLRAMMAPRRGSTVDEVVEQHFQLLKLLESVSHPASDDALRAQIRRSITRNYDPVGVARQMVAVASDGSRANLLSGIQVPTLVMHGKADPLLHYACAQDTARRIPGAHLLGIEGMGHDLSPVHFATMARALLAHLHAAQATFDAIQ